VTDGSKLGRWPRRARVGGVAFGVAIAVTAVAACDSGGKGSTSASTILPATTATTARPTTQPLTGNVQITGDATVSLPAATGECRQPRGGLPKEFVVTSAALGPSGNVTAFGETEVPDRPPLAPNVKIYVNGMGLLSPVSGTGVTVAADQQSVELDTDLTGGTGNSANGAQITTRFLKAHITGRLRCR
jgi:hypothetical protein